MCTEHDLCTASGFSPHRKLIEDVTADQATLELDTTGRATALDDNHMKNKESAK